MARKNALFPMLEQLNRAERIHVRKMIAGEMLRLLENLWGKKRLSEDSIRLKFPALADAEYATLRSRLQDTVAEEVGAYRRAKLPVTQVLGMMAAADTFMNDGQPADSLRVLLKAIQTARSAEEYTYLKQLTGLRRRLPAFLPSTRQSDAKLHTLDRALVQLAKQEADLESVQAHLHQGLDLKQGGVTGLAASAKELLASIAAFDANGLPKANLLIARTHWLCHNFLMAYDACIPYLDWAIAMAKKTPWLWHDMDAYECIEAAYFMRSTIYSSQFDFAASLALVEQFKADCIAARRGCTQDLTGRIRLIKMRKLLHSGTKVEILRGLRNAYKELQKSAVISLHEHSLVMWVLDYLLPNQEFKLAKSWISVLPRERAFNGRFVRIVEGFLVELAVYFALGEFTELENTVRKLLYFAKDKAADEVFVAVLVRGFRGLAKAKSNEKAAIESFMKDLRQHSNEEGSEYYSKIFDLHAFLQTELTRLK
jgi:hypothetical protein